MVLPSKIVYHVILVTLSIKVCVINVMVIVLLVKLLKISVHLALNSYMIINVSMNVPPNNMPPNLMESTYVLNVTQIVPNVKKLTIIVPFVLQVKLFLKKIFKLNNQFIILNNNF